MDGTDRGRKQIMFVTCYLHNILNLYLSQTEKKCLSSRSSHQMCSIEEAVLKIFVILSGKYLCWSLPLIDLQLQDLQFIKKRLQQGCFLVNIAKFLRKLIFKEICEQLLLPFCFLLLLFVLRGFFCS